MNLKEGVHIETRGASKKIRRQPGYWNWSPLLAMIRKCLKDGETVQGEFGGTYYAVVKPDYGVIERLQTEEYKAAHEKVRVTLYNMASTIHVEKGKTIPCPSEQITGGLGWKD